MTATNGSDPEKGQSNAYVNEASSLAARQCIDEPPVATSHTEEDTDIEATTSQAGMSLKTEQDLGEAVVKAQGPEDANISFPEGGAKAWLCVFGGWCCTFITFGYLNSYGIWQDYYQQTTLSHKSPSQVAWIGAFQYWLMFAPAIFAGRLFDLGFFRPLFAFGCVLLVFSQMMLSLCTEYYQIFLAQGIGLGESQCSHWLGRHDSFFRMTSRLLLEDDSVREGCSPELPRLRRRRGCAYPGPPE